MILTRPLRTLSSGRLTPVTFSREEKGFSAPPRLLSLGVRAAPIELAFRYGSPHAAD
jgi:hypothetical protein